jgi:hypothetical protein
MGTLVTPWQLRKLPSYSAFFSVCLVAERNDFYLQELHSSNSCFVTPAIGALMIGHPIVRGRTDLTQNPLFA